VGFIRGNEVFLPCPALKQIVSMRMLAPFPSIVLFSLCKSNVYHLAARNSVAVLLDREIMVLYENMYASTMHGNGNYSTIVTINEPITFPTREQQ